mmetsp:Transcript_36317/g.82796  ORF Transcript_36317/g.82796 Transcript_36317/m.82796 type:complete len:2659 (-) Transcript_36317:74-8050(-)|eukprot:CAMPEP_0114552190 /NCGR_PEP_ID=MMETSP0114-20121206/6996_1 /TAXON_ID=31324 /ORGANISM="Goniomonas sp, Strain m" /LENGTH=2658 /DNA_ID=CAMNT_0001737057 /DNA_START=60 /DNA_END=8036 /DNA_ORIENTATION=+
MASEDTDGFSEILEEDHQLEFPRDLAVFERFLHRSKPSHTWAALGAWLKSAESLSPEELKPVLRFVLGTAGVTLGLEVRHEVEKVWATLLSRNFPNCGDFATAGLVQTANRVGTHPVARFALLRWSCMVADLAHFSVPQIKEAAFAALVKTQFKLLDALGDAPRKFSEGSRQHFIGVLHKHKSALEAYIQQLKADDTNAVHKAAAIQALLQFCGSRPAQMQEHKAFFISCLVSTVFDVKAAVPQSTAARFLPLTRAVTHDEFASTLLPAIVRALKRTPEFVVHSLAVLLSQLSIDCSGYVEELGTELKSRLRVSDDTGRAEGVNALVQLAAQCSDPQALQVLGAMLQKMLTGKDGPLTSWNERHGVLSAVFALLSSAKPRGLKPMAQECLTVLLTLSEKEAHEDTRVMAYRTLGAALFLLEEMPKAAVKPLSSGTQSGNDAIRSAAVKCIARVIDAEEVRSKALDVVPLLLTLAKSAATKPGLRGDGVSAVRLLALLSTADPAAEDMLNKDKFWQAVLAKGSWLYAVAPELGPDDMVAVCQLVEVLARDHSPRVAKITGDMESLHNLLVAGLLHREHTVHSAAAKASSRLYAVDPTSCDSVFGLLWSRLRQESTAEQAARKARGGVAPGAAAATAADGATSADGGLYVRALFAAFPKPAAPPAALLPQLLLYVHHPVIEARDEQPMAFATLGHRFLAGAKGDFNAVVLGQASTIMEQILAHLSSTARNDQTAALRTARTLAACSGRLLGEDDTILPLIMSLLRESLDMQLLGSFTSRDIEIFHTAPGQLCRSALEESGYQAPVVEDKNIRRSKWEKRLYDAEEVEFEKEYRKSRNLDSAPKVHRTKQEEEVYNRRLAEEAAVRERVAIAHDRAVQALSLLSALARGNAVGTHAATPLLVPVVFPLAPLALLSTSVPGTLHELVGASCRVYSPAASKYQLQLGRALYAVMATDDEDGDSVWDRLRLVEGTTLALNSLVKANGPLSPQALTLLFPIIRAALTLHGVSQQVEDAGLAILELHTAAAVAWDRSSMLQVLINVMDNKPRVRSVAEALMLALADGLASTEVNELLLGLSSSMSCTRLASVRALLRTQHGPPHPELVPLVFSARHDSDAAVAEAATAMWERDSLELSDRAVATLLPLLRNPHVSCRTSTAAAIAAALGALSEAGQGKDVVVETLSELFALHGANSGWDPECVAARSGVGLSLGAMAPVLAPANLPVVFHFLTNTALKDNDENVRQHMTQAGLKLLDKHGKQEVEKLVVVFEKYLERATGDTDSADMVREAVVVFLGTVARFLPADDPKVHSVVKLLVTTLRTPSELVQRAVASCLPPLMSLTKSNAGELLSGLLDQLLTAEAYADRRGAAYGLGGVVKGLGISALKQFDVMNELQSACGDKKSERRREGALFAFECLSDTLGRLFEPYVIHILPLLLNCCGDTQTAVREAADGAARAVMAQLSGQGVKLVMPALLKGLEDRAWRTKAASVELLGAMAYCAPRQLGNCLPTIVPTLATTLTDSHIKVREGAKVALQHVGSVIRNPEILSLAPQLLLALEDPNGQTAMALEVVVSTTFVNAVDAPSLALLVPIVQRGLKERGADIKKRAAEIVANMCNLVADHKDVTHYLGRLLPALKQALLDPSPEVRQTTGRALGALTPSMDAALCSEIVQWLLDTLKMESTTVERAGAAQGLSEVLARGDPKFLETLLPDLLSQCAHPKKHVREGYLTLLIHLPASLGRDFAGYVGVVLPAILKGLADEYETVREIALLAGHTLVDHYADTALPLLLPAVEDGMVHDNWRIRQSSVQLLGDIMFRITGTTWKSLQASHINLDEDSGISTAAKGKAIMQVLGEERRNNLLAALYMLRSDVNPGVQQAAFQVWKAVVDQGSRTLKEILPSLMDMLIQHLSSTSADKQTVAGRALGDLVRKLQDRVLPEIIPILQEGLLSPDGNKRQGVCAGLSEVMSSTGKHYLSAYVDKLVPTVRMALCDSEPLVREAAAAAFDTLYKNIGPKAVEEVVPSLLVALEEGKDGESDTTPAALDGLRQLLSVRSSAVLPFLVPRLTELPMTLFQARALAALADVCGDALTWRLPAILSALSEGMTGPDTPGIQAATERVVLAVSADGVPTLLSELYKGVAPERPAETRAAFATLIGIFVSRTKCPLDASIAVIIQTLVGLLADPELEVQTAALASLDSVVKVVPKEEHTELIDPIRQQLKASAHDLREKLPGVIDIVMPGFCLPKGLAPLLPIFLQGLIHGTPEIREQAAAGLGEMVELTASDAMKPFVPTITGPCIRVLGDRLIWQVKAAIVQTLTVLLDKGGVSLKPFLPQLQTTFVKCLNESTRLVRTRAAAALTKLTLHNPRVDPLVNDLVTNVKAAEGGVRESLLQALQGVLSRIGGSVSPAVLENTAAALRELLSHQDDTVRLKASAALGSLLAAARGAELAAALSPSGSKALLASCPDWLLRHGRCATLQATLGQLPSEAVDAEVAQLVAGCVPFLRDCLKDDRVPVRQVAAGAVGRLVLVALNAPAAGSAVPVPELLPALTAVLEDPSMEVRRSTLWTIKTLAKRSGGTLQPHLSLVVPGLMACVKEKNLSVKLAAERALLHSLQIHKGQQIIVAYTSTIDAAAATAVNDYARRVLVKLAADSGDDDDDFGTGAGDADA